LAYTFFRDLEEEFHPMKLVGSVLFMLSGLGAIDLIWEQGGWLGSFLSQLQNPIGFSMALLVMVAFFIISWALILDAVPFISSIGVDEDDEHTIDTKAARQMKLNETEQKRIDDVAKQVGATADENSKTENVTKEKPEKTPAKSLVMTKKKPAVETEDVDPVSASMTKRIKETVMPQKTGEKSVNSQIVSIVPPLNLLYKDKGKPDVGDIKASANTIKRTLGNFGIDVEMGEVEVGPTVTRYAFKPAEGVKLARIAGLKDDLALALAAKTLRMETPIPGKALVGIEIPNRNSTMVGFGSLLQNDNFTNGTYNLPLALGKNIAGNPEFISMAKAPHILVAGTTGAGKSVTVHALINSMLYTHGPDMLKFIMVDPKRVEMTLYNGIPHLLTPVITNAKEVILALKWAIKEMERRLEVLEENSVRDIGSYHENVVDKYQPKMDENGQETGNAPEKMPYIVIVIDELADIMQAYPKELEAGIVQLAQKSRAAGIHLIISTQRPSVNVITGTIKANVPCRIALQVASAIDSRTILDMGGAEQLLGKGDMLYMTGDMSKPVRVQCAYLSETEVKAVVNWIKKAYRNEVPDEIDLSSKAVADQNVMFSGTVSDSDEDDDLYDDAKMAVIEAGKASTSYLQRRLRVGYSRAARLIDILEERGVIGPADGSRPREILTMENPEEATETDPSDDGDKELLT